MNQSNRVVITGLGMVSPLGNDVASSWTNLVNGKSGVTRITKFDCQNQTTNFAAQLQNFDPLLTVSNKDVKKMDDFIIYGIAAADEAIADANLIITDENRNRIGVAIGSGIGGLSTIQQNSDIAYTKGPKRMSPFFVPGSIINMIAGNLSIKHKIRGPNIAMATACTTGTHMIGSAYRMIQYGDADIMLCGGAEAPVTPLGIGAFNAVRALSTHNDNPELASRPWDIDRDGFVLGEGGGVLVLEKEQHAKDRGAKIYGYIEGFGMSGDGYHMTLPSESGDGAARSMQCAIDDAQISPDQIGYINAHGTSTSAGDIAETLAVKKVFGAYAQSVTISSNKSMIGHLLGAAGAVEAIFTLKSLEQKIIPPTINLHNPDPQCDLDYVPHTARDHPTVQYALSNSFGFGGTNGTLVFKSV